MKKLVFVFLIALAPALVLAQNSAVEKLFAKYGGKKGFTTVTINGSLLKMAAEFSQDDEDLDVLNTINTVKILAQEGGEAGNFYEEVMGDLKRSDYEELMTVNSDDEDVVFLLKKNGDKISEFLILVGGKEDNAVIYIGGAMRMKDLAKLGKSMNVHGESFAALEHLEDLDK